jgi:hypothetical protein
MFALVIIVSGILLVVGALIARRIVSRRIETWAGAMICSFGLPLARGGFHAGSTEVLKRKIVQAKPRVDGSIVHRFNLAVACDLSRVIWSRLVLLEQRTARKYRLLKEACPWRDHSQKPAS